MNHILTEREKIAHSTQQLSDEFVSKYSSVQRKHVSDHSFAWDSDVRRELFQQNSYLQGYNVQLHWTAKNDDSAVGFFIISATNLPAFASDRGDTAPVQIPVIIDRGELSPFDVFCHKGFWYPMRRDRIQLFLRNADIFAPISRGEREALDAQKTRNTSYASDAFGPMDGLLPGFKYSNYELEDPMDWVSDESDFLAPWKEVVSAILDSSASPHGIEFRKGDSSIEYRTVWRSSPENGTFAISDWTKTSSSEMRSNNLHQILDEVMEQGRSALAMNETSNTIFSTDSAEKVSETASTLFGIEDTNTEADVYWPDGNGESPVASLSGENICTHGDAAILSKDKSVLAVSNPSSLDCLRSDADLSNLKKIVIPAGMLDDYDSIFPLEGFKNAIVARYANPDDDVSVFLVSPSGEAENDNIVPVGSKIYRSAAGSPDDYVAIWSGDQSPKKALRTSDGVTIVPSDTSLIPVMIVSESEVSSMFRSESPETPAAEVEESAPTLDKESGVKFTVRGDLVHFDSSRLPIIPGINHGNGVDKVSAKVCLMSVGASEHDILNALSTDGEYVTKQSWSQDHSTLATIKRASDIREDLVKRARKAIKVSQAVRPLLESLCPEAGSYYETQPPEKLSAAGKETLDTVLSLGFLTDRNIRRFLESINPIQEAQSRLCALLVAGRIGFSTLPEEAVKTAIDATEEVISELRSIRSAYTATI